jgi:RimJ/RimL family protein N-acetyltransferase
MTVIETERLLLREMELSDAAFILELLNEDGFRRFIGDKGVRTLGDAMEYIRQGPIDSYARYGFGLYATCLRTEAWGGGYGPTIGMCGLVRRDGLDDADVGFAFLSRHWSKGYAAESAAAVVAYGMQALKLPRILAITAPDNWASIAVVERIGLRFQRLIRLMDDGPELKLFGVDSARGALNPVDHAEHP